MGCWVGFLTDDCRKTYGGAVGEGVEFTDGPPSTPTASTAGIRDPFGNNLRSAQLRTRRSRRSPSLQRGLHVRVCPRGPRP